MTKQEAEEKIESLFIKNTILINENEALKAENEKFKKDAAEVERVIKYLNNILPK